MLSCFKLERSSQYLGLVGNSLDSSTIVEAWAYKRRSVKASLEVTSLYSDDVSSPPQCVIEVQKFSRLVSWFK